jgi:hypothetical protein
VPAFEHERDVYVSAWTHVPRWSGKLLLRFEDNLTSAPLVDAVDKDLNHDAIPFEIPGADLINVRALGGGYDGSILVGGNAFSADSRRTGFVARISPDRRRRTLIQTGLFFPEAVALAADGTVWGAGLIFDGDEGRHNTLNVIQRYDASGRMLTSLQVPKAKGWANVPAFAADLSHLMASQDRVGWLTNGGQYIEFSLDGKELQRFDPPVGVDHQGTLYGAALSSGNEVVLGRRADRGTDVLALNRTTGTWATVSIPGHVFGVLGFDGDILVTVQGVGTLGRFRLTGASAPNR